MNFTRLSKGVKKPVENNSNISSIQSITSTKKKNETK